MTIELTGDDIDEQFQEASEEQLQWDPSDELDITYKFDARISHGLRRRIFLREGIILRLDQHKLTDKWIVTDSCDKFDKIQLGFNLSGQEGSASVARSSKSDVFSKARRYYIRSNGVCDKRKRIYADTEPHYYFDLFIQPEILYSFTSASDGELPRSLQHLIKISGEAAYERHADIQPLMNAVIQQILQCPYQGMVKRAYLESKVIELLALLLDHEIAIHQGEAKQTVLNSEQIERIYYARELLLKDLVNPPSLTELAQQVGLSVSVLGKGFRKVFDTTVFAQLQTHRLEIAKQRRGSKRADLG